VSTRTLDRPAGPAAVDPRIQARRDEVDRSRRRRRHLRLAVLGGVLALGGLVYLVTHSQLLDVDRVQVEATDQVPADQVLQVAGVRAGDQLIDVDPGTVRNRLLALPWVADAKVGIDWPAGNVHISVTQRVPVAAVSDGAGAWTLVDAGGHAVAAAPAGDPGLVAIEGLAPATPGSDLGSAATVPLQIVTSLGPGLRTRIVSVVVAADGSLQLKARPTVVVDLCTPDRIDAKIRGLTTFFAQVDDTDLATVNVCVPESPTATRLPGPTIGGG
jgi:cell division protein FtsQ